MRVRWAVVLCLLLTSACQAAKCRKKKGGKSCDKSRTPSAPGPPRWRRRPPKEDSVIEREDSRVSLRCQITGSPRPRFQWLKDGVVLRTRKSDKYKGRRSKLTVLDLEMADSGQYTCLASNPHGKLDFTFSLTVLQNVPVSEIHVVERPENQTAQEGDTVVFNCRSDSWPPPSIQWLKRVQANHNEIEVVNMLQESGPSTVLVVHNVSKEDAGEYICTMGNDYNVRRFTAFLTVIAEGEELPFEPPCALHVRRQQLVEGVFGCRTAEPVEVTYCMGSCGRSYYTPTLLAADSAPLGPHVNQTCACCVGLVHAIRIVSLVCPSGDTRPAFFTTLKECVCRPCLVPDERMMGNEISNATLADELMLGLQDDGGRARKSSASSSGSGGSSSRRQRKQRNNRRRRKRKRKQRSKGQAVTSSKPGSDVTSASNRAANGETGGGG